MIAIELEKCTDCSFPVHLKIAGLCTQVGPEFISCRKCGKTIATGRHEWPPQGLGSWFHFSIVSLIYVVSGSVIGAECLYGAKGHWNGKIVVEQFAFHDPIYREFLFLSGVLVVFAIFSKIVGSIKRVQSGRKSPCAEGLFTLGFTFGGPIKLLLLFLVPSILFWVRVRFFSS